MALIHTREGETLAAQGAGILTCGSADGFPAFNRRGTELVIWRRALPVRFQAWIEEVDPSNLPELRVLVRPDDVGGAMETLLNECGMPTGNMRELLIGDIHDLVSRFAAITSSNFVDMRLERINHNSCWKFHRDNVEARLLTTYRGHATEWIQPPHAEHAISQQKEYGGPIEALQLNDVAIFKGSAAGSGRGIVHRSPPIAGTGCSRLLLCLNQRSEVSPAPWPQRQTSILDGCASGPLPRKEDGSGRPSR